MVEVRLMQRGNRSMYYEVLVSSAVKCDPQLKLKGIVEFTNGREGQKVGWLAGAMAETLCERYSDALDPSECASAGAKAHAELMTENPHVSMGDELPREADGLIRTGLARH